MEGPSISKVRERGRRKPEARRQRWCEFRLANLGPKSNFDPAAVSATQFRSRCRAADRARMHQRRARKRKCRSQRQVAVMHWRGYEPIARQLAGKCLTRGRTKAGAEAKRRGSLRGSAMEHRQLFVLPQA